MNLADSCFLALCALVIEAAVGYPQGLWRSIGHPVSWIGHIITQTDRLLNRPGWTFGQRKAAGFAALGIAGALVLAATVAFAEIVPGNFAGLGLGALAASSLLAQRSLYAHVADVAALLPVSLPHARDAVSKIVGRDVSELDEAAVARAAIESLAENFSDGIVAPILWLCIGGLPGAALYKAINTADSMIGHRNAKYEAFGFAAARLDDFVNLPASRLAGALIAGGACLQRNALPRAAIRRMRADAREHSSPNAGWPEAAMAGALDLRLGGSRAYGGRAVFGAYMGNGRRKATADDILRALALYRRALGLLWLLVALLAVVQQLVFY